jgi:hypothetical protein
VVFTGAADPAGELTSLAPEWVQVLHSHRHANESTWVRLVWSEAPTRVTTSA